ncbi:TlpA disulfide reductase family protein [Pollutibacter soli]|uniref:TlpA family protein disulfide reductase n=1 Tax=Pollutibacter soli TaxID=3034157 RepID=UPI0030140887
MAKKFLIAFTISLVLLFALAPIGAYSHAVKLIVSFLAYFGLVVLLTRKMPGVRKFNMVLGVMFPPLIFFLFLNVYQFSESDMSFPSGLFAVLGVIAGGLTSIKNRALGYALISLLLASSIFMSTRGYEMWLNKLNFGYFTPRVLETLPQFTLLKIPGQSDFSRQDFHGKLTVLDFWNTSCGICFRKFPILDSLNKKYKNSGVSFYSVNVPIKDEHEPKSESMITKFNYSFGNLFLTEKRFGDSFNIKFFPTTLVVNEKEEIIYRGNIDELDANLGDMILK